MPDVQSYDVSYRIVLTGTTRVGLEDTEKAGETVGHLLSCNTLIPMDTDIEITSVEPADLSVEDPQSVTGLAPRPITFGQVLKDVFGDHPLTRIAAENRTEDA